jgi:serine/threonine-protein kinase
LLSLLAVSGTSIIGYTQWELIDAALIGGLTFGIYKKSRSCAVIMLLYFIGAKIYAMVETGKPSGLLLAAIFVYYYAKGVHGTFQYQAWRKAQGVVR